MSNLQKHVSPEFICPQPNARGIARTQELYFNVSGRSITEEEARDILARVMRYLFLMNFPCSDTERTPESPMTIGP